MMDWILSDDDIVISEKEAQAVEAILASSCEDVVGLVAGTGYDPAEFFEHGDWEGIDFRGSDVTGISFEGAIMTGATMYRDQFEAIRKTGPRTLDRVLVQESRKGGEGDVFTVISDLPLDPAEARADFRAALDRIIEEGRESGKDDISQLVPFLQRLDPPLGRLWALQLVLDRTEATPSFAFFETCRQGHTPLSDEQAADTLLANRILSTMSYETVSGSVRYLTRTFPQAEEIPDVLQFKLTEKANNLEELARVVSVFSEHEWPIGLKLFWRPMGNIIKSIEAAREILDMMSKAGLRPDRAVFSGLADSIKKKEDVQDFLDMMSKAGVRPDPTVFSKLAEAIKKKEDVQDFLDMMSKAGVRPDRAVFSSLADSLKKKEDVQDFLDMMSKAGVRPDPTVFSNLAEAIKKKKTSRISST